MRLKYFPIIVFVLFTVGKTFAQYRPESYLLNQNKSSLNKSNTTSSIADNGVGDIITFGDTIWIATNNGVSLSTDNGNTWTNFTNELDNKSVSAIGYYHGVFWAALVDSYNLNGQDIFQGYGLKYTSDLGKSWTSIPQPKDSTRDSSIVYGINTLYTVPSVVDQQDVVWDFAFTSHAVWIAAYGAGLRRSFDMGKTWERVVLPPDNMDSINPKDTLNFCLSPYNSSPCKVGNWNHEVFSLVAINDSTLYIGTVNGINKTTNADSLYPSWVKFNHQNQTNSITGDWVMALAYNKFNNTLWAGCWQGPGPSETYGISFSTDGGSSWQTTLIGQKVYNFAFKNSEVIAPSDNGAFGSDDNGLTWILPGTIQDQSSKLTLTTNAFYSAGFINNYTWLGSSDGLVRLQNDGSNMWTGNWKIYFASVALQSFNDTYAYPNPFNPLLDVLKIKYSTNGQIVPVTIRILDFGMHIVRTVIQNAQRGNPIHGIDDKGGVVDNWDGRNQSGSIVPNGVYFYRVDAGSMKPVYGKILVIH
ncbi:MAG: WD40/YVTN/BNR-like repeat-containing protein [Ignavibacteriaceae bacterium]